MMDKVTNSPWVMRIVSLLLALLLFASVNLEMSSNKKSLETNIFSSNDTAVLTDVPVNAIYDRQNLVVSGVPTDATVTLEGPRTILQPAKMQRTFEVYADLSKLQLGKHEVPLKVRNLSEKLTAKISPRVITVYIQERVTKKFPVSVDFINSDRVMAGFETKSIVVNPSEVAVTGARDEIEKVALVKSRVDLDKAGEVVQQKSHVTLYDREGNVLSLNVSPSKVNVEVTLSFPSKLVPLKAVITKPLGEGYSLTSLELSRKFVKVYGDRKQLEKINVVTVPIDLANVTERTILTSNITVPNGVSRTDVSSVTAIIDVDKAETRTFNDVAVQLIDLDANLEADWVNPTNGKVTVVVQGPASKLKALKASDIELIVDLSSVNEAGTATVPIKVTLPDGLELAEPLAEVDVQIVEKSS